MRGQLRAAMRHVVARPLRTGAIACALLILGGCASLARRAFAPPVVVLKDVVVKGVGLQGGSLDVVLDVTNPNEYRIDATRLTYVIFADSQRVAEGAVEQLVTLERNGRRDVVLPVRFTFRELAAAAGALMRTGSVDYRVEGEFTLGTPFGAVTRPYRAQGRYDSLSH